MTLEPWLEPLPDAEAMRATDRWAIEERGIPSLDLMERAGEGLAGARRASVAPEGPVAVVCGKGNNGGDGLVAARLLREPGATSRACCSASATSCAATPRRWPGASSRSRSRAAASRGRPSSSTRCWAPASRARRGAAAEAIAAMRRARRWSRPTCPSGVDASTGEVEGAAVRATATATFAAAKPGLWINPGKEHAGEVRVVDIGIPEGAPAEAGPG